MTYNSLLINTCLLIVRTFDKKGSVTKTETIDVVCRIMYRNELIKTIKGEEVVSYAKVFFKKTQTLDVRMQVRFAGETTDRPIIKLDQPQDSSSLHHKEVWVS